MNNLVNLKVNKNVLYSVYASSLGPALVYFRSCKAEQKSSFTSMCEALSKRFTPVHVKTVQGSMFHRRAGESVDDFAQQMVQLFGRVFPEFVQTDSEDGKQVLTNAFVSGLVPHIHARLAGADGTFEELLLRARFEEAKRKELPIRRKIGETAHHLRASLPKLCSEVPRTNERWSALRRDAITVMV